MASPRHLQQPPAAVTRTLAAWLAGLLVVSIAASAGAITVAGTVRDQTGLPMGGARVTFTGEGVEGQSFSVLSGEDGRYELPSPTPTLVAGVTAETPSAPALFQSYPNPFNPETIIPYRVPDYTHVRLNIYNALGQHVRSLVDGWQEGGLHRARWDATDDGGEGLAAGIYFYRFEAGTLTQGGKMVLADGSHKTAGGGAQLSRVGGTAAAAASKVSALATLYTIEVTGDGFLPYERRGVAVEDGALIDILVNSDANMGMLRLGLADAPSDQADAVRVTVSSVAIRRGGAELWETFVADGRTYDLLRLTDGVSEMLGEQVLDPGDLSGVRLVVDGAEIDVADGTFPLVLRSGAESGLELEGDFEIVSGGALELTLDFDVRQSVQADGEGSFLLEPVVRLVDASESGYITGALVPGEDVRVEAFDAVVIAYQGDDEVTSATVDEAAGSFRLSHLPPGRYDLRVEWGDGPGFDAQRVDGVEVASGEGAQVTIPVIETAGGDGSRAASVKAGLAAPDAAYDAGVGSLSLATEAVFFASIVNGGAAVVATGTLNQQSPTQPFTYSAAPNDKLVIAWAQGAPTEFVITQFAGDFSRDARHFVNSDHLVVFSVRREGVLDIAMQSQRIGGQSATTLTGTIILDEVAYALNLALAGTYSSSADVSVSRHESNERFTGTMSADNGFSANIDETHYFKLVLFENVITNRDRTANNRWTFGGKTYTLQGVRLRHEELNGWANPSDYWIIQGGVLEDGALVGAVGFEENDLWISIYIEVDGERIEIERFLKPQEG